MIKNIRESLSITNKEEKYLLCCMYVVNLISAGLEACGIGLVYVFLKVVLAPENFGDIVQLQKLYIWLEFEDKNIFFAGLTALVLIIFLLRILMQLFSAWMALWLRKKMHLRIACTLFSGYMEIPYSKILKMKSSLLMNNLTTNVSAAVSQSALGVVEIASSTSLTLIFMITLLIIKPLESITGVIFIGILGGIYWRLIHERLSIWGKRMMIATEQLYAAVSETVQAIKTIKVSGVESTFEKRFFSLVSEQQQMIMNNGMTQHFPRLIIESVIVVCIFGMMFAIFVTGNTDTAEAAIPTLALFGLTALRMTPAFIRIITALQLYKNTIPFIQSIIPHYLEYSVTVNSKPTLRESVHRKTIELNENIRLENIIFQYEGSYSNALNKVNLEIKKGQLVGFVGQSGSGKSTTVDILLGLLMPLTGRVSIDGKQRGVYYRHDSFGMFAYVPQEPVVLDGTFRNNIAFGLSEDEINDEEIWKALKGAALYSRVKEMPDGLNTILGERGNTLSGGEKQRLGIARALYQDASVIIFDEPTAALDANTEFEITEVIRSLKGKKTLIVIAHRLSSITHCDNIFFFEQGRIIGQGTFNEITNNVPEFKKMLNHLGIEPSESKKI